MNMFDMGIIPTMARTLRTLALGFRDLLLPRGCAGCDAPDEVLCPRCVARFDGAHIRSLPVKGKTCCYACARYEGASRRAILAWKDHGDEECDGAFACCLARLALKVIKVIDTNQTAIDDVQAMPQIAGMPDIRGMRDVLLVPAPSSPASMRRRGRWQMAPLAKRTARMLNDSGVRTRVCPILRLEGVRGRSVQTSGSLARSKSASKGM